MRRQTLSTGPRGRDALDQAFNEWEIQTEKMAHVIGVVRRRFMAFIKAAEKEECGGTRGPRRTEVTTCPHTRGARYR